MLSSLSAWTDYRRKFYSPSSLDHMKYFFETSILLARTAKWDSWESALAMSMKAVDLRNAGRLCRSITPVAQELLFYTICIDDQKRGPIVPSYLFSIQSRMFKLIRLLIDNPHLRGLVKQLHISLLPFRYSNARNAAIDKLVEDTACFLAPGQDRLGPLAATRNKSKKKPISSLAVWLRRWSSPGETAVAISRQQLSFWLTELLALLPKLQCLRLWDIHTGIHSFGSVAEVRCVTEPIPLLVRSALLCSPVAFEMLRYVSLPAYGPCDVLVLDSLPSAKTADICILRSRATHHALPHTKIKHVKNLRFGFSDIDLNAEDFLQALSDILTLFEDVRSFELYDGMNLLCIFRSYEYTLLEVFSSLAPALEPHRHTLETLLFSAKFDEQGNWYSMVPDLSSFHQLKTLKLPDQLISQAIRVTDDNTEEPMRLFPSLKMEYLPRNLESLTLDRCSGVIYWYLLTLIEYEDTLPKLCRVEVIANVYRGLWDMLTTTVTGKTTRVSGREIPRSSFVCPWTSSRIDERSTESLERTYSWAKVFSIDSI
ncbi:hypothetical protein P171DRAFT_484213 [Karstenula rhodostoma CBS 690.94]|uniref:Uncharacterized protein n=1 Tax=Karstenula rhodostoma CBS 690.94 TaxID=1392251 RepID=A0A9P4UCS4_9PLEO|nr:hypothetical protein P171DRAFT_484213 [Karstenula rhodostoma CBS 690.94]